MNVRSDMFSSDDRNSASAFVEDPCAFFGQSYTSMHSIGYDDLAALQRSALALRFEQQIDRIPMVKRMAERQGITALARAEDAVPLLLEHTMYKSYPQALLETQQFGRLTGWLDKLTSVELGGIDATRVRSIDAWLNLLLQEAGLDPAISSGTSGALSVVPWSARDLHQRSLTRRVSELQTFGTAPSETELFAPFHHVSTSVQSRADYMTPVMAAGRADHERYGHSLRSPERSVDMLWLGTRLRLAAAKGDLSRVHVPDNLLARRAELAAIHESAAAEQERWLTAVIALEGERVHWSGQPYAMFQLASRALGEGRRCHFHPDSVVSIGGGFKDHDLPENWAQVIADFAGVRIKGLYAMSEVAAMHVRCGNGRYHLQPWVIPFVLEPTSSRLLPRTGRRRGRLAFFDLLTESRWGGVITGDEAEVDFDASCSCGATTQNVSADIQRLSEKHGGDDKILCTAAPQVHAEAMAFLTGGRSDES
jgi:hypothetical protein